MIIPVFVAVARLYRGMHFLTDVVFGALLGAASVSATVFVLRRAAERRDEVVGVEEPAEVIAAPIDLVQT